MKKSIPILFIISFLSINLNAQKYVWAQSAGNTKSDKCITMRTDSLGFIYASGYFGNSLSLGTNSLNLQFTNNAISKEAWLAKFDSTGKCYWAISGGRYFDDRILGMDTDPAGNTVVTGTYWHGNTPFELNGYMIGGGPGYGSADQGFVAKVNTNGVVQWGYVLRSDQGDDQGMDVAIDKKGNVYTCGFMVGNDLYGEKTLLATDNNSAGKEQPYFVTKQDAAGNFLWAKTFGNLPYDSSYGKYVERDIACCVDENDNIYITGGFDHTRNFGNTTLTSRGHYDCFLVSYDDTGTMRYAKKFGSHKKDWCNGICSDKKGNIYLTGEHRDSLYYDGQFMTKNYDGRDVFVIKVDAATGAPLWGSRAGRNVGGERGNEIVADTNCNVYVAGDIHDNAKFGDNIILPVKDGKQAFVARITPDGKWKWAVTGGGPDSNDRANTIALGVNGQIYTGGFMRSAATFGTTTLNYTKSSDMWMARVHDSSFNKSYGFDLKKPTVREFCAGGSSSLDIPANDFFDYNPKKNVTLNSTGDKITFAPDSTTTYVLTGYRGSICRDYDTITFTITVHQFPEAAFTISPTQANLKDPNFQLTNTSQDATQYEWYYQNQLENTSTNYSYTAPEAGEYCFDLKVSNAYGCRDSVSHCALVVKKETFFIPNAFTPNGDGKNDVFKPTITNVSLNELKEYSFIIANRWGQVVFKSDDASKGWDGEFLGEKSPIGTYFYSTVYKSPDGSRISLRGDLALIR